MKPGRLVAVTVFCALCTNSLRSDVPFIRGDTNGDGAVDVVDACNIFAYLFGKAEAPPCGDAWDANDDGWINIADGMRIIGSFCLGGRRMPPPSGAPGNDPTSDDLGCVEVPVYEPIAGEAITIGISDCLIPGGDQPDTYASVWLSTDRPVVGLEFTLRIQGVEAAQFSVIPYSDYDLLKRCEDQVGFALIPDFFCRNLLGPGEEMPLFSVKICLPEGTAPGTYKILIEDARVADLSGRNALIPQTVAGNIIVESRTESVCGNLPGESPATYRIEGPEKISEGVEEFTASVYLKSPLPVLSLDLALDFNENVLALVDVRQAPEIAGIEPMDSTVVVGPAESTSVKNTQESGYVAMHVALPPLVKEEWEAGKDYKVADLVFRVIGELPRTRIALRDVGPGLRYTNELVWLLESGREIKFQVASRTLVVSLPVTPPYPLVDKPEDVQVTYRLTNAAGRPGDVGIPIDFYIESNTAIEAFAMAFMYDGSVLRCESVVPRIKVFGEEPDFLVADLWGSEEPGSTHGVYVVMVADEEAELQYFPDPDLPVATMRFDILPEAPEGVEAELAFDNSCCGSPPIENVVVFRGSTIPPGTEGTKVYVTDTVSGKVKVLGEVSIFLRGDANSDNEVNLADAVSILEYLFEHKSPPLCPDAADANDDGRLNIADPISILVTLFGEEIKIKPPYPVRGPDPTPQDSLGPCYY